MRAVALAMSMLFAAGLPALASPYDQVVVFGDSNVDNGNSAAAAAAIGMVLNPPPNFGGRNNNGPVVVDISPTTSAFRLTIGRSAARRLVPVLRTASSPTR